MTFEDLHQYAHAGPTYEQAVAEERPLVHLTLSTGETNLIVLGMMLVLANFPCLQAEVMAYIDRTREIMAVQLDWDEDGEE